DHVTRTLVTKAPQLRIRLNDAFGKDLIGNEEAAKSDTSFANIFRGIYIQSKSIGNNPFIYGFNFSNTALQNTEPINKLIMYYNVASGDTTLRKTFEYTIDNATINRFERDISGTVVEDFIKNTTKGDSLTFIQPMGGVKSVIGFTDFARLDNLLINKVELEIFVADLPGQNGTYQPPAQLVASYKNTNGDIQLISDITQLVNAGVDFTTVFNGSLNETGVIRKYTMNITNHIKNASKDKSINPEIYIGILSESEVPRRAVIYGAKHSTYPIKLKITHTKT
ncbi:MAG: DUF4270 family protein, partial [Saprospiraceae bacterium]